MMDIKQRFRQELRAVPKCVSLDGNAMQMAVAKLLLADHPDFAVKDGAPSVRLMSLEAYGSAFLASFMEECDPPEGPFLLNTIPEDDIIGFAQQHSIAVLREEHDDVREMLSRIARKQPQTFLSLARSADRLKAAADLLRKDSK
jgi:tRNA(Ile)-lysidine synthase TilS/MesJ